MIALPAGVQVWLAAGATDMRKGFDGLCSLVHTQLSEDPYSGQLFVFRGRAGDRVKIIWWSGDGLCMFAKRLERGKFVWPQATSGTVQLTAAQLSMLLEGIDWLSRVNQGGKRDNQDGKFFEGAISEAFSSDLTALEAI
jgi:transposase